MRGNNTTSQESPQEVNYNKDEKKNRNGWELWQGGSTLGSNGGHRVQNQPPQPSMKIWGLGGGDKRSVANQNAAENNRFGVHRIVRTCG